MWCGSTLGPGQRQSRSTLNNDLTRFPCGSETATKGLTSTPAAFRLGGGFGGSRRSSGGRETAMGLRRGRHSLGSGGFFASFSDDDEVDRLKEEGSRHRVRKNIGCASLLLLSPHGGPRPWLETALQGLTSAVGWLRVGRRGQGRVGRKKLPTKFSDWTC